MELKIIELYHSNAPLLANLYTSAGVAFDFIGLYVGISKAMTSRSPTDRMVSTTREKLMDFKGLNEVKMFEIHQLLNEVTDC